MNDNNADYDDDDDGDDTTTTTKTTTTRTAPTPQTTTKPPPPPTSITIKQENHGWKRNISNWYNEKKKNPIPLLLFYKWHKRIRLFCRIINLQKPFFLSNYNIYDAYKQQNRVVSQIYRIYESLEPNVVSIRELVRILHFLLYSPPQYKNKHTT